MNYNNYIYLTIWSWKLIQISQKAWCKFLHQNFFIYIYYINMHYSSYLIILWFYLHYTVQHFLFKRCAFIITTILTSQIILSEKMLSSYWGVWFWLHVDICRIWVRVYVLSRKCMRLLVYFSLAEISICSPCNLIKKQSRLKRSHVSHTALKISVVSEMNRKRRERFSWVVSDHDGMDRKEIWIEFELSGKEPMMSYHYQLPRNMRGNKHFPAHIFTHLLFCTPLPCAPPS